MSEVFLYWWDIYVVETFIAGKQHNEVIDKLLNSGQYYVIEKLLSSFDVLIG